jgi:hypothetical protein
LKEVVSCLKRGQYVRFLREITICPLKKDPKIGANIGAITGILFELITLKIIAITNITLIETSVLVV